MPLNDCSQSLTKVRKKRKMFNESSDNKKEKMHFAKQEAFMLTAQLRRSSTHL